MGPVNVVGFFGGFTYLHLNFLTVNSFIHVGITEVGIRTIDFCKFIAFMLRFLSNIKLANVYKNCLCV